MSVHSRRSATDTSLRWLSCNITCRRLAPDNLLKAGDQLLAFTSTGVLRTASFPEDLIDDLGARRDHRSQFPAVDDLGCPGGGVPGQPGDLRDADAMVAHQAHERGPELARRPAVPDARRRADSFEHLPDVPRVERGAEVSGEYQPGVLPSFPGQEPLISLAVQESAERLHRHLGKAEGAA